MRQRIPLLLVLPAVALLACATDTSVSADNQAACQDYVEAVNDVFEECGEELPFDEATECPSILNTNGVDCVEYFNCLEVAYYCDHEDGRVEGDPDACESCI